MKRLGRELKAPVSDRRSIKLNANGKPYKLAVSTMHGDVAPVPFRAVEAEQSIKGMDR